MLVLNAVKEAFEKLPSAAVFLSAVSGGADSVCLLAAAAEVLGASRKPRLFAAQVNHGLRSADECADDASAVENLCNNLGLDYKALTIERGAIEAYARETNSGIEASARKFRYEALADEAARRGASYILAAHTEDDALETFLMRVLRGAGPRGLSLMPKTAPCPFSRNFRILRPLLAVTRKDVLLFLEQRQISFRIDSTNSDPRYLRNRLRLRLLPVLDEFFPDWRKGILETAATQSVFVRFFDEEMQTKVVINENPEKNTINIENFDSLHPFLREEALFSVVDSLLSGEKSVRRETIREFSANFTQKAACLGGGISVRRENLKSRGSSLRRGRLKNL